MGFGFIGLFRVIRKKTWQISAAIILILFLSFEFAHFEESYYIHSPKRYPLASEYGFSEMVQKLNKYEGNYNKVVITDRYDQPYILLLFYKQYDPAKYQPQAVLSPRDKFNFGTVRNFDKYQFHKVTKQEMESSHNTLYVITPEEAGDKAVVDTVYFPDGEKAFVFVKL